MRIRKRPLPLLSNPCDVSPRPPTPLQIISHNPPPPTFHCFPLLSSTPQPQPIHATLHALPLDQTRHPKGFSALQEEHGLLAGPDQETFFTKSRAVTIGPPADNESPELLQSEGQRNDSEALGVPPDCTPVCISVNQILGVRRQRELADKPRQQQGLDKMKVSKRKILNTPVESESEGRKAVETVQIEVGHGILNDTSKPFEREKINGPPEHILALRMPAYYKGKRTSRERRRCGSSLSLTEHFNGARSGLETRRIFFSVLYLVISEAGGEGLTVSEAVRRLVEKGYSKLFKIDGLPRSVQVGRALRSNPFVMELKDGKFVVLTRSHTQKTPLLEEADGVCTLDYSELLKTVPVNGQEQVEVSGKRCNRKDGRGWQCHKRCKMGASYCEYHVVKIKANHERSAKKLIARKMSKRVEGSTNSRTTRTIATSKTSSKSKKNNIDNECSRSDRKWSWSSSGAATVAGASVGGGAKSSAVCSWKGQRKRVKARSLKWIEERETIVVRMEEEEEKGDELLLLCMLNSDPKEWRSDLFD